VIAGSSADRGGADDGTLVTGTRTIRRSVATAGTRAAAFAAFAASF